MANQNNRSSDKGASNAAADKLIKQFKSQTAATGSIQKSDYKDLQAPVTNVVVSLAIETARAGYGALIFCSHRKGCESLATLMSRAMPSSDETPDHVLDNRKDVLAELRSLPIGIEETLGKTVMKGVAFHRM